jgi:DNA-directed RNA polymerase alpha subunit
MTCKAPKCGSEAIEGGIYCDVHRCVQRVGKDNHRCGQPAIWLQTLCHIHHPDRIAERQAIRTKLENRVAAEADDQEMIRGLLRDNEKLREETERLKRHNDALILALEALAMKVPPPPDIPDPALSDLDLSIRCRSCLADAAKQLRLDPATIKASDICRFSDPDLLRTTKFGRKSLNELQAELHRHGWKLNNSSYYSPTQRP